MKNIIFTLFLLMAGFYTADSCMVYTDKSSYSPGETVYLTGELDYIPNGYIVPTADIYIIPNDGRDGTKAFKLTDCMGSKNRLQGAGFPGAFYDEPIAFITSNKEGEYDIIVDADLNGIYEPGGQDCFYEPGYINVFRVINTGPVPSWKLLEIQQIKQDAASRVDEATMAAFKFDANVTFVNAVGCVMSLFTDGPVMAVVGVAGWITNIPLSYNDAIINVGKDLVVNSLKAQADHWAGIALDPPDTGYQNMPGFPSGTLNFSETDDYYSLLLNKYSNAIALENLALQNILDCMEKYQGALAENENVFIRTQANGLKKYSLLWEKARQLESESLDSIKAYVNANGLDMDLSKTFVQDLRNRISANGFSAEEIENFDKYGITQSQRESIYNKIISLDTSEVAEGYFSDYIDNFKDKMEQSKNTMDSLRINVQVCLDSLEPSGSGEGMTGTLDIRPYASVSGDSVILLGSSASLQGNNSNSNTTIVGWKWDFNSDASFDDADGQNVSFTPQKAGYYIVGLKIAGADSTYDYAYFVVEAQMDNESPEITGYQPDTNFVVTNSSESFTVDATDPDDDSLSYTWILDGDTVSTSSDYAFDPLQYCVDGIYHLQVVVADDNPYSNDNSFLWTIKTDVQPDINLYEDTTICQGESIILDAGAVSASYSWSTGETSQTITVSTADTYFVDVTGGNGCSNSDTCVIAVEVCSDVNSALSDNVINVYPNPNDGEFTLEIGNNTLNAFEVKIISVLGQVIYEEQVKCADNTYSKQFNLKDLSAKSGLYCVRINSERGSWNFKFVVK